MTNTPKSTAFNILLQEEIASSLRRVAEWRGLSQGAYIRTIIYPAIRRDVERIEAEEAERSMRVEAHRVKLRRVK